MGENRFDSTAPAAGNLRSSGTARLSLKGKTTKTR